MPRSLKGASSPGVCAGQDSLCREIGLGHVTARASLVRAQLRAKADTGRWAGVLAGAGGALVCTPGPRRLCLEMLQSCQSAARPPAEHERIHPGCSKAGGWLHPLEQP